MFASSEKYFSFKYLLASSIKRLFVAATFSKDAPLGATGGRRTIRLSALVRGALTVAEKILNFPEGFGATLGDYLGHFCADRIGKYE